MARSGQAPPEAGQPQRVVVVAGGGFEPATDRYPLGEERGGFSGVSGTVRGWLPLPDADGEAAFAGGDGYVGDVEIGEFGRVGVRSLGR